MERKKNTQKSVFKTVAPKRSVWEQSNDLTFNLCWTEPGNDKKLIRFRNEKELVKETVLFPAAFLESCYHLLAEIFPYIVKNEMIRTWEDFEVQFPKTSLLSETREGALRLFYILACAANEEVSCFADVLRAASQSAENVFGCYMNNKHP